MRNYFVENDRFFPSSSSMVRGQSFFKSFESPLSARSFPSFGIADSSSSHFPRIEFSVFGYCTPGMVRHNVRALTCHHETR